MNHFTNQSNGSQAGRMYNGGAIIRRFALFPLMLLMLLLLPARMAAQTAGGESVTSTPQEGNVGEQAYAVYDKKSYTLTFCYGTKPEGAYSLKEYGYPSWYDNRFVIYNVVFDASFANARPTNCSFWFKDFMMLNRIEGIENLNTEQVTDMYSMFSSCSSLTSLDVTHFNTANVTDMSEMFDDCSKLTSLDVTNFNTVNVTKMKRMFSGCSKLTSLDVTKFNTANVKDMTNMFSGCSSLTSLDVTNFNTENVMYMSNLFNNCSKLTSLDVTNFNTANVTYMNGMFSSCSSLTSLDVTNFNTENVMNMVTMFSNCSSLTSLDVTNFNTANVTYMSEMFSDCSKLTTIYASSKFVTTQVSKSIDMFNNCKKLKGEEVWTEDKATDKTYAKIEGGYFSSTERPWVKYADGTLTFYNSFKDTLGENEYELNRGTNSPGWAKHKKEITKVVFDTSFANAKPTSCYYWFCWCEKLRQIEGIKNLNTEMVTNMKAMFANCLGLSSLDVSSFNTEKVTDMTGMFVSCINLKLLDVTKFNTANVKSMEKMFSLCQNLVSLDVTNFNTANVTDMSDMFYWCSSLHSLDVTKFNTANVKSMANMFNLCHNLVSLDVTNFNTENVTSMRNMFGNNFGLSSLDVTNFNTKNVTNMTEMFQNCIALKTIYVGDKFVTDKVTDGSDMFLRCDKLKGANALDKNKPKTGFDNANYKTGYFTKLVGKNGDEKIGATGETLATDNLVLDDDKDFVAYEPFAAKAASYSRTMKEGTTWATLCLPFEVSLQNQNFRAFKLLSADDAAETVELEEIKTSIAAGTPVIIKMKDGATKLSFTGANKTIANEVKTAETANSNYQLQGLYTQKVFSKAADNNCYIVKGEKLMNPAKLLEKTTTKFVGSKPFRAYMEDKSSAPVAGARMFSIRIGDGTTAIKQLEADAADTADGKAEYYDLQGHRLQDLQKGVNIVKRGGKTMKVVIK